MKSATVELLGTGESGTLEIDARGGQAVQVCRAMVSLAGRGRRVTLYMSAEVPAAAPSAAIVARLHEGEAPDAIAVRVLEATVGRISVECPVAEASEVFAVGAAAAVMRASWAWDESSMIVSVNGAPVALELEFVHGMWYAAEAGGERAEATPSPVAHHNPSSLDHPGTNSRSEPTNPEAALSDAAAAAVEQELARIWGSAEGAPSSPAFVLLPLAGDQDAIAFLRTVPTGVSPSQLLQLAEQWRARHRGG